MKYNGVAEFFVILEAHTRLLAFFFGLCFISMLFILAIWFPQPTPFQDMVFRIILALAAAGIAGVIPGLMQLELRSSTMLLINAGGALAVFVLIYLFAPAKLDSSPDNGGMNRPNFNKILPDEVPNEQQRQEEKIRQDMEEKKLAELEKKEHLLKEEIKRLEEENIQLRRGSG